MPSLALNVLSLFRSKSALPDDIYTRNSPARSSRDLLTSDLEHDIYARDAHVIGADQYVWDAHFDSDWDECDAGPQLFQAEKFRDYEKVYHVIIKEHRGLENEEEDNLVQYNLETLDSLHEVAVRERDSAKRIVELRRMEDPNGPRYHVHLRKWMNRQQVAVGRIHKLEKAIEERKENMVRKGSVVHE